MHRAGTATWPAMTSHRVLTRSHGERPVPSIFSEGGCGDTVHMSTVRKLLLAVLLVSLTGSAFGAGTFASFNASTTNPGSTFATGSIVLSNTKAGGAGVCFSTNTGVGASSGNTSTNANNTCDSLFGMTLAKPGDTATAHLTLKNEGSIAATSLAAAVTACTTGTVGSFNGSTPALLCGSGNGLKIQVQEMTDATFTVPVLKCVYPPSASLACVSNEYLGNGFLGTTFTNTAWNVAGMASAANKYLKFTVQFPDNGTSTAGSTPVLDNAYMGLTGSFGIAWTIAQ